MKGTRFLRKTLINLYMIMIIHGTMEENIFVVAVYSILVQKNIWKIM